ncbi:MAG: type II toxin-antitoxin system RelE/ParE family toxin [Nanoarchaeota archaeon]
MSYLVEWDKNSYKFLEKLPLNICERILKKIDELKEEPFRYLEHFERKNYYKFRIGDYRALIDIDLQNKILTIQVLDKRGRVYKR